MEIFRKSHMKAAKERLTGLPFTFVPFTVLFLSAPDSPLQIIMRTMNENKVCGGNTACEQCRIFGRLGMTSFDFLYLLGRVVSMSQNRLGRRQKLCIFTIFHCCYIPSEELASPVV